MVIHLWICDHSLELCERREGEKAEGKRGLM
jgi:hypothetical protein